MKNKEIATPVGKSWNLSIAELKWYRGLYLHEFFLRQDEVPLIVTFILVRVTLAEVNSLHLHLRDDAIISSPIKDIGKIQKTSDDKC